MVCVPGRFSPEKLTSTCAPFAVAPLVSLKMLKDLSNPKRASRETGFNGAPAPKPVAVKDNDKLKIATYVAVGLASSPTASDPTILDVMWLPSAVIFFLRRSLVDSQRLKWDACKIRADRRRRQSHQGLMQSNAATRNIAAQQYVNNSVNLEREKSRRHGDRHAPGSSPAFASMRSPSVGCASASPHGAGCMSPLGLPGFR